MPALAERTTVLSNEGQREDTAHSFTLILEGPDPLTDEHLNSLVDAGCDDAMFGARSGVPWAAFDRKAPSLAEAVAGAIRQVEGAVPGLRAVRVEPEELVSAAEIARRVGRTRETVRLWIEAKRGRGNFPPPACTVGPRRTLWRWADVAQWLASCGISEGESVRDALFLSALNGALEVRHVLPRLQAESERRALAYFVAQDAALLGVPELSRAAKQALARWRHPVAGP